MALPWYQRTVDPGADSDLVSKSLNAFGVFTFVEAAILLVAAGVLFLIWARMEGKGFHLPGGDGLVISLAGGWAVVLLIWRVFDRPGDDTPGVVVGVQWGFIVALGAAAALVAAGARVRAAHRPEPPNPAEDLDWESRRPAPAPARERPRAARRDRRHGGPARPPAAGTASRPTPRAAPPPREPEPEPDPDAPPDRLF